MSAGKKKISSLDYPELGREAVEASGNGAISKLPPGLYVVATPIGNLGDITLRALATLAQADAVMCEDTRASGILLNLFGIKKPLFSCHDHNEDARTPDILRRIGKGEAVALISDAGLPAIADPGFRLVRACREAGHAVTVIPGANAALTALAGSGLPTDRFLFAGFLPPKSTARKKDIAALRHAEATLVFYESPQRLAASLADLAEVLGAARAAAVARELTKLHEETRRGTLGELAAHYAAHDVKGEIVILVERGADETENIDVDALLDARLKQLSVRDAVAEVAAMTGLPKKEIYARALARAPAKTTKK
ncbi:MAG: 16S rRNA (cytidine(1402)-2'-O)-methyltransferase [Alphaproteobacteria bacterium]|nr:16S rRNA (cytidine(1402)-2'-O)-methyltransferase [Alphaproteobacteria bacterium]